MNIFYNSYIVKIKKVKFPVNFDKVFIKIQEIRSKYTGELIIKGESAKEFFELKGFDPELGRDELYYFMEQLFHQTQKELKLEIIIREPNNNKSCLDENDTNAFNWVGQRNFPNVESFPLRSPPFFFRKDGMPVDLLNLYAGQSIFLICNGPSLKELDLSFLNKPGIMTFGINNGAHEVRPNFWTCVDDPSRFMESIWRDPKILKFIPMASFEKPIWSNQDGDFSQENVGNFPNVIGYRRNERFNAAQWMIENSLNWGNHKDLGGTRSVLLPALRICYLLGFKHVYLLGCDFKMSENQKYFFEEQRTKQAIKNNNNAYEGLKLMFSELKPEFDKRDFYVFNCNRESGLKVFPFKSIEEAKVEMQIETQSSTMGMYVDRNK